MQMASSAKRACRLCRSASEYTATVRIPRYLQAQMTRMAISPRLAIRILRNISAGPDGEQRLTVFPRPAVLHKLAGRNAGHLRFNPIHELHCVAADGHRLRLHAVA